MKEHLRRLWGSSKQKAIRLILFFSNSVQSKKFQVATYQQVYDFANSGFFYKAAENDFGRIYKDWECADRLWRIGEYRKSVELRKNSLALLYSREKITDLLFAPSVMSVAWTSAFGHIGSLGVFSAAQKLGIVSSQKRVALVQNQNTLRNLKKIFSDVFILTPSEYGHTALENPSQWHISERLQMVKAEGEFICLYELHDRVFKDSRYDSNLPQLSGDYIEWARTQLEKVGLPKDCWFVSLHVRDNFGSSDTRSVNASNFNNAVDEIISRGGWVIQFGANSTQSLLPRHGLINLNQVHKSHTDLHFYVISRSKFLLTTNSGPSVIAWSLGTPVLQTNTTSIARNMLRATKGSLFLPKHYRDSNNRELTYGEIAQGRLGYSESTIKELNTLGFQILENTPIEIYEATKDLLSFLDGKDISNDLMETFNTVRDQTAAVGFGNVAPSFLQLNSRWVRN